VGRRDRLGLTHYQSALAVTRDIYGASRRWAKEIRSYSIHPRGTLRVLLHSVKSYDMGPPALLSIRKVGVLQFFIALKTHGIDRVRTRNLCVQWQAH
jgi:hypothetical protein